VREKYIVNKSINQRLSSSELVTLLRDVSEINKNGNLRVDSNLIKFLLSLSEILFTNASGK